MMYRPIGDGYRYGYNTAGTGKAHWRRMTFLERMRLRRRRRKVDDLECIRAM